MKLVTLSSLRTQIRARGEWRSAYISNTDLDAYINNACYKFYNMVAELDPLRYTRYGSISVVSGTQEYDLPTDLYKLISAYVSPTSTPTILDTFEWEERFDASGDATDPTSSRWLVKGSESSTQAQDGSLTIMFQPVPSWTGAVYIDYIPTFIDLSIDSDDFDTINGIGLEWVISDVAIKCASKEETDTTPFEKEKAEAEVFIKAFVKPQKARTQPSSSSNTLLNLKRAVRGRGGWTREAVSDITLVEWLNASYFALVDIMIKYDDSFFLKESDISVVSGTKSYSLPSDMYHLLGVSVESTDYTDGYAVLERFNWAERYDYRYITHYTDTRYMLRGGKVYFHPEPTFSKTVRLEYIPTPTRVTTDASSFANIPANWQEWLILDTCVKIAVLAGTDPAAFAAQKAEVEQRIAEAATQDIGKPKTMVDVRRSRYNRRINRSRFF